MTEKVTITQAIQNIVKAGGKVVRKKGKFWEALHKIVKYITFGGNDRFLKGYYTTIGPIVGVPEGRDADPATLEHELVHINQAKKFGAGNPWLGLPIFGILYLLLPLPMGLAYFRYRFERVAYVRGINVKMANQGHKNSRSYLIDRAVMQLTTGAYGWTWPFPKAVRAYFEKHID